MAGKRRRKLDPRLNCVRAPALLLQTVDYVARMPPGKDKTQYTRWLAWYLAEARPVPPEVTAGLLHACSGAAAASAVLRKWRRKLPLVENADAAAQTIGAIHSRAESALHLLSRAQTLASAFAYVLPTPEAYEEYWHTTLRQKICEGRARARFVRQCPSCGELFAVQDSRMECCTQSCRNKVNYEDRKRSGRKREHGERRSRQGMIDITLGGYEDVATLADAVDVITMLVKRHGKQATLDQLDDLVGRARRAGKL